MTRAPAGQLFLLGTSSQGSDNTFPLCPFNSGKETTSCLPCFFPSPVHTSESISSIKVSSCEPSGVIGFLKKFWRILPKPCWLKTIKIYSSPTWWESEGPLLSRSFAIGIMWPPTLGRKRSWKIAGEALRGQAWKWLISLPHANCRGAWDSGVANIQHHFWLVLSNRLQVEMDPWAEHKGYTTIRPQPSLLPLRHRLWLCRSYFLGLSICPPSCLPGLTSKLSSIINSSRKLTLTLPKADLTPGPRYYHSARKRAPSQCLAFCYHFIHVFSTELWVSWGYGLYFPSTFPSTYHVVTTPIILVVLSRVGT